PDEAARLLDDAIDGRKTEARAFAQLFGGEERLEDARLRLRVHAAARVADDEGDERAGRDDLTSRGIPFVEIDVLCLDGETAAARHSVARVGREVHDHLLDLSGIGFDLPKLRLKHGAQLYVLADQAA